MKIGIDTSDESAVEQLQGDLNEIGEWSQKWQMPFNSDKCKVMHIGQRNIKAKYELLGKELEAYDEEKDLGVIITNDLKPSKQYTEVEKKAQKCLVTLNVNLLLGKKRPF